MLQLTQALRRNSFLEGRRVATVYEGREKSWAQLRDRVARLASGLRAKGARPGDRIGVLSANSDLVLEAYYAICWAGCVFVPFNTRWAPSEIEHALSESRPFLMFIGAGFMQHREIFAGVGVPVIDMDATEGELTLEHLVASFEPMSDESGHGNELAGIFYTGGTTGRSKGVMVSHNNLLTNFFLVQSVQPYARHSVFLHVAPMFHMADAHCLFGLSQVTATHVVLPGFDPEAVIRAIERHRVTALLLVPTMIARVCETLAAQGGDVSSVRRLFYGASPISSGLLRQAMELLPNAEFMQGYGQTEVSCCLTVLDHQDHLEGRLESAGRALPGCDVRVVDASLNDVPIGTVGEIATRGPCVMMGYWEQPEATAEALVDGWLLTGDAGRFDEEGYLYLVDRVKDMIVTGGENVYSAEVERALMKHPDIAQCAVIGVPDPQWGERVHAILCVRDGAHIDEASLRAHCEPLLARYKHPKSVELRRDPLPLSAVGKIAKAELRKPYWAHHKRAIA